MIVMKRNILLLLIILLMFSACNFNNPLKAEIDLAKKISGTWETDFEYEGLLNQKYKAKIFLYINLIDKPYYMLYEVEGKKVKIKIQKYITFQDDQVIKCYKEENINPQYIVLKDNKHIELKGGQEDKVFQKIVSSYK